MAQEWSFRGAMEGDMARVDNGFMSVKGVFYLLGGRGIQPVGIYNPDTDSWNQGAPPPVEMHHFQAARLGEELWVLGAMTGSYPDVRPLEHIYVYNTAEDSWRRDAPIPQDRLRGAAGVAVYRACLYLVGGTRDPHTGKRTAWVDRYDTRTGKWKKLADAPRSRDYFNAGICDGKIYAVGGMTGSSGSQPGVLVPQVDVYDIESGRWNTLPEVQNLPTPRAGNATVMILDNILVIGGHRPDQYESLPVVEAYDVHTGQWIPWAPLGQGRSHTQAVMCAGHVYIASGRGTAKNSRGLKSLESLEF